MDEVVDGLWIGDIQDAREKPTSQFDRVITVCQENVEDNVGCKYDHFCMADGPHNSYGGDSSYELFHEAAITLLGSVTYGEEVLIHCHMGRSRSASVVIAVLGALNDVTYSDALSVVTESRYVQPDKTLAQHAKKFIQESEQRRLFN